MTTALSIIQSVRNRLSDPSKWTQGVLARDINGEPVDTKSQYAVCHCLIGAISMEPLTDASYQAIRELVRDNNTYSISVFNDTHTHAEVLNLLDTTIKRLNENS